MLRRVLNLAVLSCAAGVLAAANAPVLPDDAYMAQMGYDHRVDSATAPSGMQFSVYERSTYSAGSRINVIMSYRNTTDKDVFVPEPCAQLFVIEKLSVVLISGDRTILYHANRPPEIIDGSGGETCYFNPDRTRLFSFSVDGHFDVAGGRSLSLAIATTPQAPADVRAPRIVIPVIVK